MFFLRIVLVVYLLAGSTQADICVNNYLLSLATGEKFCVSRVSYIYDEAVTEIPIELAVTADDLFLLEEVGNAIVAKTIAMPEVNFMLESVIAEDE